MNSKLFFHAPAARWNASLPIGNGRLAAMLDGGEQCERVALNHEQLWQTRYSDREVVPAAEHLGEVRDALRAGDYRRATELAHRYYSGEPRHYRLNSYVPAGDLYLEFDQQPVMEDYRRELDLATAVAATGYSTHSGECFKREFFAGLGDDRIFGRVTASGRPFNVALRLDRIIDPDCTPAVAVTPERLILTGRIDRRNFVVAVDVLARGGEVRREVRADRLVIHGAEELIVAIDIATSTDTIPEVAPFPLAGVNWDALRDANVACYRAIFERCRLDFDLPEVDLATDRRMQRLRDGIADPGLIRLYFDYGRYLFIAATARGQLPPNLQGKWNRDIRPSWMCCFTLDVNLQMAYWGCEATGMGEGFEALMSLLERAVPFGRHLAQTLYGCRGVYWSTCTDDSAKMTPESYGWTGFWAGSAAWLANQVWRHWQYAGDRGFLAERAYPLMREVARFWMDFLTADDAGTLQVMPSSSPENRFEGAGDWAGSCCISAACDLTLVADILDNCIRAGELLGADPEERAGWRAALERLEPLKIGVDGRLLEWNGEFVETEPGHRHFSHLVGLYPLDRITPWGTPELFAAAAASFDRRMASDGGHTGWSRSWSACLAAALGRGQEAQYHLDRLIADFSSPSLLDLHPPFQIDGNFGGMAAVAAMLLGDRDGVIELLPALPPKWPDGRIAGLRARGGFVVDIAWRSGTLHEAAIRSERGGSCRLRLADGTFRDLELAPGQVYSLG